jgi:site-specific recombinase XerC
MTPSQRRRSRARRPKKAPGECYTVNTYRQAIRRACDQADKQAHKTQPDVSQKTRLVPRWAPNRIRHTAGTEIRKRHGLEAAQVVLGHSRADVTQVYAERDFALAERIMRQIG